MNLSADLGLVEDILGRHNREKSAIIGILQDVQRELRYLPQEILRYVAKRLEIPLSQVYSLATFYKAFRLEPRGEHLCTVCLGTACHVRGGTRILEKLERDLRIKPGETTEDMKFTLETVNCLGACALGPIVVVDEEYRGEMNLSKVDALLKRYGKA